MFAGDPRLIDWRGPIDLAHPLYRGTVGWWPVVRHHRGWGSLTLPDTTSRWPLTLTLMEADSDWITNASSPQGMGALDFDGTGEHATNNSRLGIDDYPFTIACWCMVRDASVTQTPICLGPPSNTNSPYYHLRVSSSGFGIVARTHTGGHVEANSARVPANYEWVHLAGVFVSDTSRFLYVDGVQSASSTTSVDYDIGANPVSNLHVGRLRLVSTTDAFNGQISDAHVWSRALSASEVRQYYTLSRDGFRELFNYVDISPLIFPSLALESDIAGDYNFPPVVHEYFRDCALWMEV